MLLVHEKYIHTVRTLLRSKGFYSGKANNSPWDTLTNMAWEAYCDSVHGMSGLGYKETDKFPPQVIKTLEEIFDDLYGKGATKKSAPKSKGTNTEAEVVVVAPPASDPEPEQVDQSTTTKSSKTRKLASSKDQVKTTKTGTSSKPKRARKSSSKKKSGSN